MPVICSAITKAGARCTRAPLEGRQHCLMHDPASEQIRREAAAKGGRARSSTARAAKVLPQAMTAQELAGVLSALLRRVVALEMDPKIATAAATLGRAILEAQEAAARPSLTELQAQVDELRVLVERGRAA